MSDNPDPNGALDRNTSINFPNPKLDDGSRVAVIGAGPAGSFFSYFLLEMAERAGMSLAVDVYEPRDFDRPGPAGCNNCGGVVSEWLVQTLATDGIILPPTVVKRGIDSYVLHMDTGTVRIDTPIQEKRIAAVHRGGGPIDIDKTYVSGSFDKHLFGAAQQKGAQWVRGRIDAIRFQDGFPQVKKQGGDFQTYDLVAVATGKQAHSLKMFEGLPIGYKPPRTTKTYISEIYLGQALIAETLGNSFHVFLLDLPHLKFAALIPKGDYVTMCLLGEEISKDLIEAFVNSPEVKACMPPGWMMPDSLCHCGANITLDGAENPYADRLVFVGDCSESRLYKDGIGAAYRTAKAAAVTAVFEGISAEDFRRHYAPVLRSIAMDNQFGRFIFMVTGLIQKMAFTRSGMLRMVRREQARSGNPPPRMSGVLWDTFTGSAPYRDVFVRSLHPAFLARYITDSLACLLTRT